MEPLLATPKLVSLTGFHLLHFHLLWFRGFELGRVFRATVAPGLLYSRKKKLKWMT